MKRVTAFLSVVMLLIVMLPASAIIASAATEGDWEYAILDDGTAKITEYNGSATTLTIPSKIGRYTVTTIGRQIVYYNTRVTTIVIPNTVTTIDSGAFEYCSKLTKVTIPNSVTELGAAAFEGCDSLTSVTVPGSVNTISANTFNGCDALKNVVIQSGVTAIGGSAFSSCKKLESITLPNTLESIGSNAFYYCESLQNITLPASVTSIGNSAFYSCKKLESITVPKGVKEIEKSTFSRCSSLQSVVLGSELTRIGTNAFYECDALEKIVIPSKVTRIDDYAFYSCDVLESVIVGNSVESIWQNVFAKCENLKSITLPKSLKAIYANAFKDCVNLNVVYYLGNETQWNAIDIRSGNGTLTSSKIHYNWYPDVKSGDWYNEAVEYVSDKGCMSGYKNGNFGPANNLQRQDFVVMLARIAKANLDRYLNSNGGMIDVSKTAYFAGAVAWAVDNGIITGYKNGKFGVSDKITREQVATILYRYCGEPTVKNADATLSQFPDKNRISPYAKNAMAWAVQNGVISGTSKGTISPATGASRAQIATIIMRMYLKGLL